MATELEIRSVIHAAITQAYQKPGSPMGQDTYIGQDPLTPEITEAVFQALNRAGLLTVANK
jgi:hypothetical protein